MSREDLDKFKKMILRNSVLQERLKEAVNQEDFIESAMRLGEENKCSFTAEEIEASIEEENQKLANMTFGEKVISQIAKDRQLSFFPRLGTEYYWFGN